MSQRVRILSSHLCGSAEGQRPNNDDDVVIVAAARTPIGKAQRGSFQSTYPEELLSAALKGVVERAGIDPNLVDDIIVGNVLQPGAGAMTARMAALHAGFPEKTSVAAINRQCSSGLQAVASIASAISSGFIQIGIGAGVESMTMNYNPSSMPLSVSEKILSSPSAADCQLPMGITSENVAEKFGVSRQKQDMFAFSSYQKASQARKAGLFRDEIVPVATTDNDGRQVAVAEDDGIRENVSLEGLKKLKPAFRDDGSTTAGNSSQVSDGAAAVLLMRRRTARMLGLPILGRFVTFAVVGVPPSIMGIGPALAIPEALEKAQIGIEQVDIFEINEAFASQAVYCVEKLGIDMKKVNPKGGAIALGHPLGCTGARQIATLLPELKRTGGRIGVVSMCVGTGMGAAAVLENEQFK